jgi:hypothetical protein
MKIYWSNFYNDYFFSGILEDHPDLVLKININWITEQVCWSVYMTTHDFEFVAEVINED